LGAGEPGGGEQGLAAGLAVNKAAIFLDTGDHGGDEDEHGRPNREGVVLLVGGDGEKQQREG
jgi:hypothetical protein